MCLRKCKVTFMLMGVNAEADVGEFIVFEFFSYSPECVCSLTL